MPSIKKILLPVALLAGGIGVGSGAAYATGLLFGAIAQPVTAAPAAGPKGFVEIENLLAPLVLPDGERVTAYVAFTVALEVPAGRVEEISARTALLRHEINMRTYRTPMASGPDGMLPTLSIFHDVVRESAIAAFGKDAVSRIAIVRAAPG